METLMKILSMKRPHGGANETRVATEILSELPDLMMYNNAQGVPMAYLYTTDEKSRTLFVSHLDTVHSKDGDNPVEYDPELQWMWKTDGECLGADDGAGVWLTYEMARAGVPGTYIWTVGEERGGIGARWLADHAASYLATFDRAISFDRKGTTSVITHQGWGSRCCSDGFATTLAEALHMGFVEGTYINDKWTPDDTGVYTDTAEFTSMIPECTNLSIGYMNEHGGRETLDVGFLIQMREVCIKLDWENLPTLRDPKVVELSDWGYGYSSKTYNTSKGLIKQRENVFVDIAQFMEMDDADIQDLIYDEPEAAYDLLLQLKYSAWSDDKF